nr:hypothetical protein [Sedimentisphaera salicampi]
MSKCTSSHLSPKVSDGVLSPPNLARANMSFHSIEGQACKISSASSGVT